MTQKPRNEQLSTVKYEDAVAASKEYFAGDELAAQVWVSKYALKDSFGNIYETTPRDMHNRIAGELARIENNYPNPLSKEQIFELLDHFRYVIPQGGPMTGIGNNLQVASLSNCFVIGMDGKQSEVGDSNGRSGKSLIGELMRNVMPIAYIPGKNSDIFKDQFVWNDVQENTKLVFIDDVLQNFNFEFLFPNITGDWSVNYKGGRRGADRIVFSNDGLIFVTYDHYETFIEIR